MASSRLAAALMLSTLLILASLALPRPASSQATASPGGAPTPQLHIVLYSDGSFKFRWLNTSECSSQDYTVVGEVKSDGRLSINGEGSIVPYKLLYTEPSEVPSFDVEFNLKKTGNTYSGRAHVYIADKHGSVDIKVDSFTVIETERSFRLRVSSSLSGTGSYKSDIGEALRELSSSQGEAGEGINIYKLSIERSGDSYKITLDIELSKEALLNSMDMGVSVEEFNRLEGSYDVNKLEFKVKGDAYSGQFKLGLEALVRKGFPLTIYTVRIGSSQYNITLLPSTFTLAECRRGRSMVELPKMKFAGVDDPAEALRLIARLNVTDPYDTVILEPGDHSITITPTKVKYRSLDTVNVTVHKGLLAGGGLAESKKTLAVEVAAGILVLVGAILYLLARRS